MPNFKSNQNFKLLILALVLVACLEMKGTQKLLKWGTHLGSNYLNFAGESNPSSILAHFYGLDDDGTNKALLVNGSADTAGDFSGDLIELGFFDTDGVKDSSYTGLRVDGAGDYAYPDYFLCNGEWDGQFENSTSELELFDDIDRYMLSCD